MSSTANPRLGANSRETVENAAEALGAAVVLMECWHSYLCHLFKSIVGAFEHAVASVAS